MKEYPQRNRQEYLQKDNCESISLVGFWQSIHGIADSNSIAAVFFKMAAQVFSGCMNLVGRRSFLRKKKIDQILHFLFEIDTFRTEWCKEVKKILTEVSLRWSGCFQSVYTIIGLNHLIDSER